jgi:spore maturation protein CgeB
MRIVFFCHSLVSDWNNGNAHFLRGVASELLARGHDVRIFEPANGWSAQNLRAEHGETPFVEFQRRFPQLKSFPFHKLDLDAALDGADLVIVHEWNEPELVKRIGMRRSSDRNFRLLFHDTHHRAVSAREEMAAYDLSNYDGVLAYGDVLRQKYLAESWIQRAWTWQEAADTRVFKPNQLERSGDVVWVGNWGDEERSAELREFLIGPIAALQLNAEAYGVRYPDDARRDLAEAGIRYCGWAPNFRVANLFSRFKITVHVPRRPYIEALPGIPTIRMFEALACAIPLISSPWTDTLFMPGADYLVARNRKEMQRQMRALLCDKAMAREIGEHGHRTVLAAHTCGHRVNQLLQIYQELRE